MFKNFDDFISNSKVWRYNRHFDAVNIKLSPYFWLHNSCNVTNINEIIITETMYRYDAVFIDQAHDFVLETAINLYFFVFKLQHKATCSLF